jgi:hypothetical protein
LNADYISAASWQQLIWNDTSSKRVKRPLLQQQLGEVKAMAKLLMVLQSKPCAQFSILCHSMDESQSVKVSVTMHRCFGLVSLLAPYRMIRMPLQSISQSTLLNVQITLHMICQTRWQFWLLLPEETFYMLQIVT